MARRFNLKFVGIFSSAALGAVGMVYVIEKLFIHQHPDQYINLAHEAEANQQWADAVDDWNKAIAITPEDPELWTEQGIALHQLAKIQSDVTGKPRDELAWEHALEIDPNYLPAVRALVHYWREQMGTSPGVIAYQQALDRAEQFLRLAPTDPEAQDIQAFLYTTTIQGYISGIDSDEQRVNDTVDQMRQLMAKDPANADLPYYLATLDIRRAADVAKTGDSDTQAAAAAALYQQAEQEMTTALTGQDSNPLMHYRAAQIFAMLSSTDPFSPQKKADYLSRASQEVDKSLAELKGSEPRFTEIHVFAARMAIDHDLPKAKQVMRSLLAQKGSDPVALLQAAQVLERMPEFRPQAIETLQSAFNAGNNVSEIDVRRYEILAALTELQISEFADSPDGDAKNELKTEIDGHLKQMVDAGRNRTRLARAQAFYYMTQHDYIDTIQALTAAMAADPQASNNVDLMYVLAQAYMQAGERQQAEVYLRQVVLARPDIIDARKMLVQVLSSDRTEDSRQQISEQLDYLVRAAPNDPSVIRLEMLQMDPDRDADQLKAMYAKLPEETVPDIRVKASIAITAMKDPNEAVRLMAKWVSMQPDDVNAIAELAEVYSSMKQNDLAVATVQKGLTAHPNDPNLLLLLKKLQNASPEELERYKEQLIAQTTDQFTREMQEAAAAEQAHDTAGVEQHLKAAEAIKPTDTDVWQHLYTLYLSTKQFDKVDPYVDKLASVNFDQAHGALYHFEVAHAKNDVQQMMDIASQLVTDLPEFAMSYYCLGQACQAQGQWEQAIANYDTALQKKGGGAHDAAMMLKAEIDCYYHMNRPDRAVVAMDEGRRRFPNDPDFSMMKLRYEMTHGEPEAAAQELDEMRRANPTMPEIYLDLATAQMQVAQLKRRIPDVDAANAALQSARDTLEDASNRFPDDLRVARELADILRTGGDVPGGEAVLQKLGEQPAWQGRAETQELLAEYYTHAKLLDKAEAAYRSAMIRSGDDPGYQTMYAQFLASNKRYDDALALLQSANTQDIHIQRQILSVLVAAGRLDDAETAIKSILDTHPPDAAELQANWAELEMNLGRFTSATDHDAKALAIDPKSASALSIRGRLRMLQVPPDTDGAMADLTSALASKPNDSQILLVLTEVYLARFDTDGAIQLLEGAIRANPDDIKARLRLATIYASSEPVRLDDALRVIQDGLSLPENSDNPDLQIALSKIDRAMGKVQDAIDALAEPLRLDPNNLSLLQNYLSLLLDAGQYDRVVQGVNGIVASPAAAEQAWFWKARGQAKAHLGDKAGASSDLLHALDLAESHHDIVEAVGAVDAIAADVSADQAIELARKRQGTDTQWDICLIKLDHERGDDAEAVQLLEPILSASGNLPPAERTTYLQLAGVIYSDAHPKPLVDKGYAVYRQLLDINPNDVQALNNLACLCSDGFQPPRVDEGLGYVRRAIDILSKRGVSDPTIDDTYGWLLVLGGQTSDGIEVLRHAMDRQPLIIGYYHLGEGYLRSNRPEDAQLQVNLALEAIAKAQAANQPVDPVTRAKIADLSSRVLDSLRLRTSGSVP